MSISHIAFSPVIKKKCITEIPKTNNNEKTQGWFSTDFTFLHSLTELQYLSKEKQQR